MTRVTADPDRCTSLARGSCGQKCLIASLVGMTVSSLMVCIVFWWTNFFSNFLVSTLVVTKDSPMLEWWVRPPIRAAYNIRILNYTNVEEFMSGKDLKLRVQEVGPYVYRETLTRVNTRFYPNGTLSFQEKRSYQWEGGNPDDDMVVVPNIPLLSAMAFARDMSVGTQLFLNVIISALLPKTFLTLSVREFLWGYDDQLFDSATPFLNMLGEVSLDKFGVLAMKNGVSRDVITMHTGEKDLSKMGMIDRVNGVANRNIWGDDSCDKVYGSAGFIFPPDMYKDPQKHLDIYTSEMCRTFKLDRVGEGSSYGIPTISYKPPKDGFDAYPGKDYCFCPKASKTDSDSSERTCAPKGIFNMSACAFDTPMVASFPHFFGGDPSLFSKIEGLEPKAELHQSHLEIHPKLGLLIGGHSRVQMNIEARRAIGIPFLEKIEDGQILPILWIEIGIDAMPENILSLLKQAYFTSGIIEASCQYGSILCIIFWTSGLFYLLWKNRQQQRVAGIPPTNVLTGESKLMTIQDRANLLGDSYLINVLSSQSTQLYDNISTIFRGKTLEPLTKDKLTTKNIRQILHRQNTLITDAAFQLYINEIDPLITSINPSDSGRSLQNDQSANRTSDAQLSIDQARANDYHLNKSLYQIDAVKSLECSCGDDAETQDIDHVLWHCPRFTNGRQQMLDGLRSLNCPEPYTIASVLTIENTLVLPVIDRFLKTNNLKYKSLFPG